MQVTGAGSPVYALAHFDNTAGRTCGGINAYDIMTVYVTSEKRGKMIGIF